MTQVRQLIINNEINHTFIPILNNNIYFIFQAGMHAVRENRYIVLPKDFEKGYKNNIKKDESEHEFYK